MDVIFHKSGITSWGQPWEWTFGNGVTLKNRQGNIAMTTYFNLLEPEFNFEKKQGDLHLALSPENEAEWGYICWNCFQQEREIYGMIQNIFEPFAKRMIQDDKARHPGGKWVPEKDFSDMLAECLDAVRKQLRWGGEDKEWLFNCDGPVNEAVDVWLARMLRDEGYDPDEEEDIPSLTPGQLASLRKTFERERCESELQSALLQLADNCLDAGEPDRARCIRQNIGELTARYAPQFSAWENEVLSYAEGNNQGIYDHLTDAMYYDNIWDTLEEYVIKGKKYRKEEIVAVYEFWRDKLNDDIVDNALHEALGILQENSPDIEEFAQGNIEKVTRECRTRFPGWKSDNRTYLADCDKSYSTYAREAIEELYDQEQARGRAPFGTKGAQ